MSAADLIVREGIRALTGFPAQCNAALACVCEQRGIGVDMFDAVYQGQVIARSDDTVVIEGNRYFPPGDVEQQCLQRSRMKTLCPWKGVASYYTVQVHGASDRNAAWTYRHPSALARSIKNHIAFWGNVTVRDTDAG